MSKPRLAEILGVEVEERFKIKGFSTTDYFYVGTNGWFYTEHPDDFVFAGNVEPLCEALNNPDSIIREPKWTQQDINDAKAIKRLMPWVHRIGRDQFGTAYVLNANLTPIDASCFKGLKQDEEVELDEILNSEL